MPNEARRRLLLDIQNFPLADIAYSFEVSRCFQAFHWKPPTASGLSAHFLYCYYPFEQLPSIFSFVQPHRPLPPSLFFLFSFFLNILAPFNFSFSIRNATCSFFFSLSYFVLFTDKLLEMKYKNFCNNLSVFFNYTYFLRKKYVSYSLFYGYLDE